MILRRVELPGFGKWKDRTFEFRRGANLVLGGNEGGKTTLAAAIPAVLFGVRDKARFVPWEGAGGCEAALVWDDRQHFWRLARNMRTDEVDLTIWHEGGEVLRRFSGVVKAGEPCGEYAEILRELCGLDGAGLLAAFGRPEPEADFPAPPTVLAARHRLEGEFAAADEELRQVRRRLAELEERWYELRPVPEALREALDQLEELPGAAPVPDAPPPPCAEAGAIREDLAERLARRRQLQEELAQLGLPAAMPPDLPLLLAEGESLRRELVALQKESVSIRQERAARPAPPWKVAAGLAAVPLLLGLAGSLWFSWSTAGWLGGALLAVVVWLGNSYPHGRHVAEDARLKGQAQAIEGRREAVQELLTALDDRFRAMGVSPSAVSLVKLQKAAERGRIIADELRRIEGALSVLEKAAAPVAAGVPEPLPVPTLSAEEQAGRERRRQLLREKDRLRELLLEREQIEEEGERLRDREVTLAGRLEEMATSAAASGPAASWDGHFPAECGRLLALLGGGRHWQVAVGGQGGLTLREGEGSWRSPAVHGHGVCDLLGLAARLAADGGGHLPLLLDEALAHVERARMADVLGVLERIAAERQVIVFCREDRLPKRLARERWQVVSLDGDSTLKERDDHAGQLHLL